ncbi:TonB-dependent siderophore receptor [Roseateles sp. BYS180W]|uniref:TonB-dependent siderophore receptor n=1 Tax=Roseateles rivi TaxID=3299028 RepID=A0ABW7FYK4_9BURK
MSGHRFLLQPKPVTLATLALLCSAHAASWAQAQEPSAQTQAEEASLPTIKARAKRDSSGYTASESRSATGLNLSLRDTPQAVSVITRERMDDAGMATMADVFRAVPGLAVLTNYGDGASVSARGFEVNNLRLDGMPLDTSWGHLDRLATAAFESVEVTRGAAGLTAGVGDPSASISMVRKRAQARQFEGQVALTLGTQAQRGGTLDLSTGLNREGSLRARVVAHTEHRDGHFDLERRRTQQLLITTEADLGSATRLTLGYLHNRGDVGGGSWQGLPVFYSDGSRTAFKRGATLGVSSSFRNETLNSTFLKLNHQLSPLWRLQAEVSRDQGAVDLSQVWLTGEVDRGTGLGLSGEPSVYWNRPQQVNAMLGLQGHFDAWGRRHELSAGVQRLNASIGWQGRDIVGPKPAMESLHQWRGLWLAPPLGEVYKGGDYHITQTAGYLASRLQLSDAAKLILGARVSDYRHQQEVGAWSPEAYTVRNQNVVTPYGGLVWDLNEQISAYLSHAGIFKHQAERDRNGKYLDPLQGQSQELGLKGEWWDGKLQGALTLFNVEQHNFAVEDVGFKVPGTAETAKRAVRGVRSRGVELELHGQLSPTWKLSGSLSHYRVRHPQGEVVLAYLPRSLFKLSTQHRLSGALLGWHAGAQLHWQGADEVYTDHPVSKQSVYVGQKSFALLNLNLRRDLGRQWHAQLNIENALDRRYRQMSWGDANYKDGAPRTVKLTLNGRF